MDGGTLHYEDLRGQTGRKAFFRPRRFAAMDLFPTPPPVVRLGDAPWKLHDLSLSGIAVTSRDIDEAPCGLGDAMPIVIDQGGTPIFAGIAQLRRSEPSGFGTKLALEFEDSFVDIPALRRKDEHARMRAQFSKLEPSATDEVVAEYRMLCTDVLDAFGIYREFLSRRADSQTESRGSGAFELCLDQLLPQWRALWLRGNELTEAVMEDKPRLDALKRLSERVLTPEFCHGPIWDRSYTKPLGYPGDFQVMNYVYDWKREGETTYGQLIHRLGLDVAECIGTRMDVVISHILKLAEAKEPGEAMRCLSLGSGPAREVKRIFEETARGTTPIEYTLVDQEEQALQYAYEGNYPSTKGHRAGASISCLNLSFTDILRGNLEDKSAYDQDIVYSVGLFDYLKDRRARGLAKSLFELVKPGGMLVLGNMNKVPLSNLWPMEVLTDWRLYYRDDAEMLGWAEALDADAAWTETEPTDRVRLLFVRKKG